MKVLYLWFVVMAIGISLSGCSTRTRIGMFIPGHYLSDHRDGEEVWLHVAPSVDPLDDKAAASMKLQKLEEPLTASGLPAAALGAMAVGVAIDYIKAELQEEAQRYEASYGRKAWLSTWEAFGSSNKTCKLKDCQKKKLTVLVTRWVESPLVSQPKNYKDAINEVKSVITNSIAQSTIKMSCKNFEEHTKGKSLAFAYAIEIDRAETEKSLSNAPFLVRPLFKWQWLSKAKIVSFKSINPLSWLGSIFLQTGSEIEYNVRLTIDGLLEGKDQIPAMVTLGLSSPLTGPDKFDLSGNEHWKYYEKDTRPTFGWIAIPGYPKGSDDGFFSIQLTVNESDPSNVKKTILKGSDYLEKNKSDIVNRVIGN